MGARLAGKTALVTGSSSGIGEATAHALARAGAHVLLVARTVEKLDAVAGAIKAGGGRASVFPADLGEPDQIARLAQAVFSSVGVPDIVINNAGVGRFLYLDETATDELRTMADVPFVAALLVTREFLPAMIERGRGHIVVINSPVSRLPWPGATGYAASRWGLRGLSASLRMDLRGTGVGFSEVVPGKVTSDYFANNPGSEDRIPSIGKLIPDLSPEQVGDAVVSAIVKDRAEVLLPWQLKAFEASGRHLPRTTNWLISRTGTKRGAR